MPPSYNSGGDEGESERALICNSRAPEMGGGGGGRQGHVGASHNHSHIPLFPLLPPPPPLFLKGPTFVARAATKTDFLRARYGNGMLTLLFRSYTWRLAPSPHSSLGLLRGWGRGGEGRKRVMVRGGPSSVSGGSGDHFAFLVKYLEGGGLNTVI